MGGHDPWIVAEAVAVPEPSTLVLMVSGAVCGIAVAQALKRLDRSTLDVEWVRDGV